GREQAGEQARVGREGERHGRGGRGEAQPLPRQPVEGRGLGAGIAVSAQVVGAHGVQGDEEEVRRPAGPGRPACQVRRARRAGRSAGPLPAGEGEEGQYREEAREEREHDPLAAPRLKGPGGRRAAFSGSWTWHGDDSFVGPAGGTVVRSWFFPHYQGARHRLPRATYGFL